MYLPSDPVMLLSAVNMKLRDQYASFSELVEDLDVDGEEIERKLLSIGYRYDENKNQFL